ncbi:MAG: hypothetical protein B7X72_02065 [Sphingobacteriia bacterium 39-39-8]|nr:MAG: hypothetical protein B7X72_02065 [Sphingobacteriia bacterium 39-39-8]HQR92413.1 sulfatase [Sediminibacterium sp.]
MTNKYRYKILFITALFLFARDTQVVAQVNKRPNVILILVDDLGWSCFSSKADQLLNESKSDFHETPNIDKLASQSIRFTRGYSSDPICTPARRSIQFGQSSIRQGDESFQQNYQPAVSTNKTIPQVLKAFDNRYQTAHFGKWDLRAKILPEQLGYDESDGDTGNKNGDKVTDKEEKWNQHYITVNPKQMDSITVRSIRFMKKQVQANTPFYLQVSHYATHVNTETNQASYEKFLAKDKGKKHDNPAWAGMINDLDTRIGLLLKEVEQLGISDNTYIFLLADNGAVEFIPPVSNRLDPPASFDHLMRNYPLRGGKWTLYEGGIRVPFMIRGPGIKAGIQTDEPAIGWDILPTINELVGNKNKPNANIDGGSLVPLIKNQGQGKVERLSKDLYFHRYNNGYPHSAIISENYKLIKFWKTKKIELFNIKDDLGEVKEISKLEPELSNQLEAKLLKYMESVNPDLTKRYL